ncbi:MAG: alpha-L-arabinofuranosidase C-terminal domain-containing protein [Bacteroidota bacterium]|nr:alpha-L-arabinofuranosidase C-terminal domain-containing protein [Bacteroidota bacterium]
MSLKSNLYFLLFLVAGAIQAQPKLTANLAQPGIAVSPTHYGIFFEDINHAADGGLYAELIRNRSFEDAATPDFWTVTKQTGGVVTASIETQNLLNKAQSKALKLKVDNATPDIRVGVSNSGFWGINVVNGRQYKLTFFAKCDASFTGTVTASLESASGVQYARTTVTNLTADWQKYSCTLTATGDDTAARFVLSTNSTGTLWFDVISLFPPTFNNRDNGLRPDLAQLLVNLKPSFVRFPGGCFIEGDSLSHRFQWKNTIGKIEDRPGHKNLWGYRTSDGMGFHEFLQLCEDLNAAPLYVVNVGLSHTDYQSVSNLTGYIQDVLDALEYANASTATPYGAMRAANGHAEPFNIKYLEIGNENYFGNNYGYRYYLFYNAIKAKYPDMQFIGNAAAWGTDNPSWTFTYPVNFEDEHYYRSSQWFINQYKKYDTYSRTGTKAYVGEYAVTSGCGNGNLKAALGEAVYMAGMENNSDVVPMNSYAPIFVNNNDRAWNPDMINYTASKAYGTPSYYVQQLFSNNIGTVNIPVKDSLNTKITPVTGAIGLGTWSTVADYSNVVVTSPSTTLFSDNFTGAGNWTSTSGNWNAAADVYSQTATSTDCRSVAYQVTDSVYTYSLKARKVSGNEGFLIIFGYKDTNNFYWWNLGGWGNTQHAIEQTIDGSKATLVTTPGTITANQWYDIRIEVSRTKMMFYLNNALIHTLDISPSNILYTTASLDKAKQKFYLKVINPNGTNITANINLSGSAATVTGSAIELTSDNVMNENTFTSPVNIAPVESAVNPVANSFNYTFKANSVTILKLNTAVSDGLPANRVQNKLILSPNPVTGRLHFDGLSEGVSSVEINNLIGQLALKGTVTNGESLDVSAIKTGIYMVQTRNGSIHASAKIIKQ